jgi:hypothetical protein
MLGREVEPAGNRSGVAVSLASAVRLDEAEWPCP